MHRHCQLTTRTVLHPILLLVLTFLATSAIAETNERDTAPLLSLYETALQSLDANQMQRFRKLAHQLEAFPLYPYLRYTELSHRLKTVSDAEVQAYFDRYPDLPITPRLRMAWLGELARRQDWPAFLANYRGGGSASLRCALVRAEFAVGRKEQAITQAQRLWPVGYRQPQSCNFAFDLLAQAGVLTTARIEHRILLALRAGHNRLAADLVKQLAPADRGKAAYWLKVYLHPKLVLQHPPQGSDKVVAQLLTAALGHLARDDPMQAHRLWLNIKSRHVWGETVTGPVERTIALRAAYNGLPGASNWLRALPAAQVDATVRVWRVRSALRQGDWKEVARAVKEMPARQRQAAVWRYWWARALAELGQRERAAHLYRTVATQFSYYGFLAADALDVPYRWGASMPAPDLARQHTLRQQAAVQRALLLQQAGQHELAQLEWRALIRHLSTRDRLAAARIAEAESWPWATLYAAARAGVNNASFLRFPKGYLSAVERSAQESGIKAAWLLALIRQESAFGSNLCSQAGACGLMQLMPATARWVLERNGKDTSDLATTISAPVNNITVGACYLAYLRARFSSHVLALAAYNAGPGNVADWVDQPDPPPGSARWIETLLYGETRRYLQAVIFNEVVYRLRLTDKTLRVSQLLRAERQQRIRIATDNLASE